MQQRCPYPRSGATPDMTTPPSSHPIVPPSCLGLPLRSLSLPSQSHASLLVGPSVPHSLSSPLRRPVPRCQSRSLSGYQTVSVPVVGWLVGWLVLARSVARLLVAVKRQSCFFLTFNYIVSVSTFVSSVFLVFLFLFLFFSVAPHRTASKTARSATFPGCAASPLPLLLLLPLPPSLTHTHPPAHPPASTPHILVEISPPPSTK